MSASCTCHLPCMHFPDLAAKLSLSYASNWHKANSHDGNATSKDNINLTSVTSVRKGSNGYHRVYVYNMYYV